MRRPVSVSLVGWFLVVWGLSLLLLPLLYRTPTTPPQLAGLAEAGGAKDWLDVVEMACEIADVVAGVLLLRGMRAGRTLCLVRAVIGVALSIRGLPGPMQPLTSAVAVVMVAESAILALLLFRRPARQWLGAEERSFDRWSVRGVAGGVVLAGTGFLIYSWMLVLLVGMSAWLDAGLEPPLAGRMAVGMAIAAILIAAVLGLGLAIAPGPAAGRRTAVVVLCASLMTLNVAVLLVAAMATPAVRSLLPPGQVSDGFGRCVLMACPVLLAPLAACVLSLRRAPMPTVANVMPAAAG